jgi:hypothetical protein
MNIVLILNEEQALKLEDVLSAAEDEGPHGEGWKSKELTELFDLVEHQITKQKGTKR